MDQLTDQEIKDQYIEITGIDLSKFVAACYEFSRPQGMGWLHAQDGPLDQETIDGILNAKTGHGSIILSMDYVHGRAVKMTVYRKKGGLLKKDRLFIRNRWFDHSPWHIEQVFKACEFKV